MKRVIVRLANHLRPAGRSGTLGAVTCAAGANVLGGLGQQLNHVIAGTISDCLGATSAVRSLTRHDEYRWIQYRLHRDAVGCASHRGSIVGDLYWPRFAHAVETDGDRCSRVRKRKIKGRIVMQTSRLSERLEAAILEQVFSDEELESRVRGLLRWKFVSTPSMSRS